MEATLIQSAIVELTQHQPTEQALSVPHLMSLMFLADVEYYRCHRKPFAELTWVWLGRSPFSPEVYKELETLIQRQNIQDALVSNQRSAPSPEGVKPLHAVTEHDDWVPKLEHLLDVQRQYGTMPLRDLSHLTYVAGRSLPAGFTTQGTIAEWMIRFQQDVFMSWSNAARPEDAEWGDPGESAREDAEIMRQFSKLRQEANRDVRSA